MGPLSLILTELPLPAASVKLGSFVPDITCANRDAYLPASPKADQDFVRTPHNQSRAFVNAYKQSAARLALTQLLSAKVSITKDDTGELHAQTGFRYDMLQPLQWFKDSCEDATTKTWLQQAATVAPMTAFMIVGMVTLNDAVFTQSISTSFDTSNDGTVPMDVVASAASGVPVSTGGLLDVSGGFDIVRKSKSEADINFKGEYVFAIAYKRVVFKWFSSKKYRAENASLGARCHWYHLAVHRGPDAEEKDIVEASLSDRLGTYIKTVYASDDETFSDVLSLG